MINHSPIGLAFFQKPRHLYRHLKGTGLALLAMAMLVLLTGCGGTKVAPNITLPSRDLTVNNIAPLIQPKPIDLAPLGAKNEPVESGPALATRAIKMAFKGKNCLNNLCGKLTITSVAFIESEEFSNFIDLSLATMASVDSNSVPPYQGLESLGAYFVETASPRTDVVLQAKVLRNSPTIVVMALSSYIFSGGANGQSSTQYLNWLPDFNRLATLQSIAIPERMPQFIEVLKAAHQNWLMQNRDAMGSMEQFSKQWPFKPSYNVAIMQQGLQVSYDPFTIAPKSFGEPKIFIPYDQLQTFMRPEFLNIAKGL
jgi:hypothetical protein